MRSALDHLVLNTRFETDAALALFEALGFTVTPRGFHTLGSINHLIVFEQAYLELIGLPLGTERLRQEVLASPVGIDGLVLASPDADVTHDALRAQGFQVQPVQAFSRPVDVDGSQHDARFRTVRLVPGQLAAGRVYFCEQQTPELVWRPEWMAHANGVTGLAGLVVVGAEPAALALRYAALGPMSDDFALSFMTPAAYTERYGSLAAFVSARGDCFGAIRLRADDPQVLAQHARRAGLPVSEDVDEKGERVVIALPAFQALLECAR
jgi:hypothetical protein